MKEWNECAPFVRPEHVNSNEDTLLMYFTSGTTGEPKMVAHDHLYALGHLTTGVYWHNLHENSIHLTVADTGWGKAVWASSTDNGLPAPRSSFMTMRSLRQRRLCAR